ncbi:hypothetical protein [Metallosphaera tengchongensis]|nr:hypothetical protein [Metallosphaera tengchongensis]
MKSVELGYARVRTSAEEFKLMAKRRIEESRRKIRAIQSAD